MSPTEIEVRQNELNVANVSQDSEVVVQAWLNLIQLTEELMFNNSMFTEMWADDSL